MITKVMIMNITIMFYPPISGFQSLSIAFLPFPRLSALQQRMGVFRNVYLPAIFKTQSSQRNTEYSLDCEYFMPSLPNSVQPVARNKNTTF